MLPQRCQWALSMTDGCDGDDGDGGDESSPKAAIGQGDLSASLRSRLGKGGIESRAGGATPCVRRETGLTEAKQRSTGPNPLCRSKSGGSPTDSEEANQTATAPLFHATARHGLRCALARRKI